MMMMMCVCVFLMRDSVLEKGDCKKSAARKVDVLPT